MGKRGNHVPERWTTWLRVEEKWRMAVARTFLHTNEERHTLLFMRARGDEGKVWRLFFWAKVWRLRARQKSWWQVDMSSCYFWALGVMICQVAILPSWFVQLLEANFSCFAKIIWMPRCFAKLSISNSLTNDFPSINVLAKWEKTLLQQFGISISCLSSVQICARAPCLTPVFLLILSGALCSLSGPLRFVSGFLSFLKQNLPNCWRWDLFCLPILFWKLANNKI